MSEVAFTDANFQAEVLEEKNKPVLVDFWASWCGPCKMQGPIVDEVAKEMEGKAKVGKLEVDQNPGTAQQYQVMSIPTIVIFKGGKPVWNATGVQQKEKLISELKNLL
ncbi:MAG: thioredoxin [Patescibacteria group bacterium]|jgi:thioredoxin 1